MASRRRSGVHPTRPRDLDLDPATAPGAVPVGGVPAEYLRLVANPFLGIFLVVVWFAVGGVLARVDRNGRGTSGLSMIAWFAALALIPRAFHYHCLDCGKTGRLWRWREHLCPRVAERRLLGRPRRFRGPTPGLQTVLWLWVFALVAAGVLLGVEDR